MCSITTFSFGSFMTSGWTKAANIGKREGGVTHASQHAELIYATAVDATTSAVKGGAGCSHSATHASNLTRIETTKYTMPFEQEASMYLDYFLDEPGFLVEDVHPCRGDFPVDQQRHPHLRHGLQNIQTTNHRA